MGLGPCGPCTALGIAELGAWYAIIDVLRDVLAFPNGVGQCYRLILEFHVILKTASPSFICFVGICFIRSPLGYAR